MSNGEVRKVSLQDIQLVQNLIERCLQLYMSQREVVSTLLHQAKIEPGFTELVWQKLEAENQEFFRAYYLRLIVKDQIIRFNQLIERQVELMRQICPTGIGSVTLSNGSQIHPLHNNSAYGSPQPEPSMKTETLNHGLSAMPNVYTNGASTLQPCMQVAANMAGGPDGRINVSDNMLLAQSSNAGLMQGMNRGIIKPESGYATDTPYIFGAGPYLLEPRNAMGEVSVSTFNGGESSSQTLNENMFDTDMNSFGFLDILENYSRSPFLGADANFLEPHIRGEHQDLKRLDTISEGLSYEDFGSE